MDILILTVRLLLTILLYAFLIAVFAVLWRDVKAAAGKPVILHERKARLVVLPDSQAVAPPDGLAAFPLQPFTTLGRSPANTIVLPDTFASAEHALISWRGGQWWLEDLGSRNGTRLNDEIIIAPAVLSAGDVVAIGQISLKVEFEA